MRSNETSAPTWRERISTFLRAIVLLGLALIAFAAPLANRSAAGISRVAVFVWFVLLVVAGFKVRKQPLALPMLVLLALLALSSTFSVDPQLSWDRMLTYGLATIAMLTYQMLSGFRSARRLILLLMLSTLISVAYSFFCHTTGQGVEITAVPAGSPAQRAGLLPGDVIVKVDGTRVRDVGAWMALLKSKSEERAVTLELHRYDQSTGAPDQPVSLAITRAALTQSGYLNQDAPLRRSPPPRAAGFFHHYFPYAEFLALLAPIAFAITAYSSCLRRRLLWGLAFLAMAAALALTLTRIAWLACLLSCCVVAMMRWRKFRIAVAAASMLVLLAGAWWITTHRGLGLLDANDAGTQYRLLMWRDGLRMVPRHPWLGVGLNTVSGHWQWWELEAYRRFPLHSHFHSTWIQLAVEAGIPALLAWLWLMAGYHRFLRRLMLKLQGAADFDRATAAGIYTGFLGTMVIALVQYNWGDPEVMAVFWLLMGIAFVLDRAAENLSAAAATPTAGKQPVC